MGTCAGIEFKATKETVDKMVALIPELDEITNASGLDVSCTPIIYLRDNGVYAMSGQTHSSYCGQNGRALVKEIKLWIERHGFDVEIIEESYA